MPILSIRTIIIIFALFIISPLSAVADTILDQATATPVATDQVWLIDDPAGTPSDKRASVQSIMDLVFGTLGTAYDTEAELDSLFSGKQDTISFGTGVETALGVNIGSAGALLTFNGAGGTPSSMTLTNATGLPFAGLADSANIGRLDQAETIAANWVNTANPWADNEVADNITASNYLPLAGGTLTNELTLDETGVEFQETDAISDCSGYSATGGGLFYDDSEGKFKKCQDNVLTDLDTGGGAPTDAQYWTNQAEAGLAAEVVVNSAATLETAANLGAYASDILGAANEAGLIALMPNYVDQDVTIGASPTLDGANFTAVPVDALASVAASTQTVSDSGDGSPATANTTPNTSGYPEVLALTCSDADGCTMTMGETSVNDSQEYTIVNVSANNCTMADSAGVQELPSPLTLAQYESITLVYRSDRWVEKARATNSITFTSLDMSGGTTTLGTVAGAMDAGGATSLEVPNGANPTTNAAGEIAVDSSAGAGQGVRAYGADAFTLPAWQAKCTTIAGATASSDYMVEQLPYAITVQQSRVTQRGATNVVGHFDECDSAGASCAGIDGATDITATTTATDDGTLSNPTIDANDVIQFHTTSVSGTNTDAIVCIYYTVDQVN